MSNGLNELDRCLTCGHTRLWHENNSPRHPFNFGQDGATDFLKSRRNRDGQRDRNKPQGGSDGPQIASLPTDPVLRIALVNAGVLKPADLVIAEEQLRNALVEGNRLTVGES